MSNQTTIKLSSSGDLVLVLPGKDGSLHDIVLQAGKAEAILRTLLSHQEKNPLVGKQAGPSWKFLLESGLLASAKVTKIPTGQKAEHLTLNTRKKAEDLGL
jgi:hypothetical protein